MVVRALDLLPPLASGVFTSSSTSSLLSAESAKIASGEKTMWIGWDKGSPRCSRRWHHLWVPETLHMSCDVLIFVEEAADAVVSLDLA